METPFAGSAFFNFSRSFRKRQTPPPPVGHCSPHRVFAIRSALLLSPLFNNPPGSPPIVNRPAPLQACLTGPQSPLPPPFCWTLSPFTDLHFLRKTIRLVPYAFLRKKERFDIPQGVWILPPPILVESRYHHHFPSFPKRSRLPHRRVPIFVRSDVEGHSLIGRSCEVEPSSTVVSRRFSFRTNQLPNQWRRWQFFPSGGHFFLPPRLPSSPEHSFFYNLIVF